MTADVIKLAGQALRAKASEDLKAPALFFAMLPPIPLVLDIEIVAFADNPETGQSSALLGLHLPNEFRLALVPVLQPGQTNDSAWEATE